MTLIDLSQNYRKGNRILQGIAKIIVNCDKLFDVEARPYNCISQTNNSTDINISFLPGFYNYLIRFEVKGGVYKKLLFYRRI